MKSEKVLIIYSLLACLFLMLVGIFSARTTNQLLTSFIYLPLVFFFGSKIFYELISQAEKTRSTPQNSLSDVQVPDTHIENLGLVTEPTLIKGVADSNKRLFLQLIGTTGISLLVMALFSRSARDAFLGGGVPEAVGVKNIAGNTINPAEKSPTDGYSISDIDDTAIPAFYSFVNNDGAWYIMQNTSGTFRYAKGDANYSASWDIRNKLHYDYYDKVFS